MTPRHEIQAVDRGLDEAAFRALLDEGAREVVAIERDPRFLPALEDIAAAYDGRLRIVESDALDVDFRALAGEARARGAQTVKIVANLPYNIATPLLLGWLRNVDAYSGLTLMFQKEVAARLDAAPRGKDYGRLSVIAQWLCEVQPLFQVPARAFTPPPKVTSTVVGLIQRAEHLAPASLATLEKVTAAAFGQRTDIEGRLPDCLVLMPASAAASSLQFSTASIFDLRPG